MLSSPVAFFLRMSLMAFTTSLLSRSVVIFIQFIFCFNCNIFWVIFPNHTNLVYIFSHILRACWWSVTMLSWFPKKQSVTWIILFRQWKEEWWGKWKYLLNTDNTFNITLSIVLPPEPMSKRARSIGPIAWQNELLQKACAYLDHSYKINNQK